jgi:hypothetical protein
MLVGVEEGLLDGISGLVAIRDKPVDKPEKVVLVAVDQLVEGVEPTAQSLLDEGGVNSGIGRACASIVFGPRVAHD